MGQNGKKIQFILPHKIKQPAPSDISGCESSEPVDPANRGFLYQFSVLLNNHCEVTD